MNTDTFNLIGEKVLETGICNIINSYIKPDPVYENIKLLNREIETINTFSFEKYYNNDPSSIQQANSIVSIPATSSKIFCYISFMDEVDMIAKLNKNCIVDRIKDHILDCNTHYGYEIDSLCPSIIKDTEMWMWKGCR